MTIPKQHGAWTILIACYILGLIGSGVVNERNLLFAQPATAGFLVRHTLNQYLRTQRQDAKRALLFQWLALYLFIALAIPLFLIFKYELLLLIPIGLLIALLFALSVFLNRKRQEITVHGELIGIFGLSIIIPATVYASIGEIYKDTIGLWLVSFLFFSGSVFHVRYLVRNKAALTAALKVRIAAGFASLAFHLSSLLIVSLCSAFGVVFQNGFIVFIPVTFKAFYAVLHRYETPPSVKGIGFYELTHTAIFIILVAILL